MVAECGVLRTHVTQVVEQQGIRRVGLDAGMNALMRPTLYDAYHGIHNLARIEEATDAAFDVVGPICASGDVFGAGRMLPASTGEGDVVLIHAPGASGFRLATHYNPPPPP